MEVDRAYMKLQDMKDVATQKNMSPIIGGDWNAAAGSPSQGEEDTVGPYARGLRNKRGATMVHWATEQQLLIVDTFFEHAPGDYWTYSRSAVRSKIDYFVVDKATLAMVGCARASEAIGTGIDHRTIEITIEVGEKLFRHGD